MIAVCGEFVGSAWSIGENSPFAPGCCGTPRYEKPWRLIGAGGNEHVPTVASFIVSATRMLVSPSIGCTVTSKRTSLNLTE